MRISPKLAACVAVLAALAACGEERGPGGLTSDEDSKLNSIAEKMEAENVTDTSADGLTVNDEWSGAETGEVPATGNAANAQ